MAKVIKKTSPKLSPEEKFWKEAEKKSKVEIDRLLNRNLPIEWRPQDLDLEKNANWRTIARDDVPNKYEDYDWEELEVNNDYLAQEIAYHYILTLIQRILDDLRIFACHNPAYFEYLLNEEY